MTAWRTVADIIGDGGDNPDREPDWHTTANGLFAHGRYYLFAVLSTITGEAMTPLQIVRAIPWNRDAAESRWSKTDPNGRTLIVHGGGMWIVRGPDVLPGTRQRIEHQSGVETSVVVAKARAERWAADNPPTRKQLKETP